MTLLVITVVVALAFDFTNGFHDTANAVATSVSTRALTPRVAVAVAALANLAGAFATTAVATTVGKGIIDSNLATEKTVLAAVVGAIVWNLLTWRLGPAVVVVARADRRADRRRARAVGHKRRRVARGGAQGRDPGALGPDDRLRRGVSAPARASTGSSDGSRRGSRTGRSALGQLASGTWVAFTHGANDAQKTMGVIALALYSEGQISSFYIPDWVKVTAGLAIAAGTYSGGWRIMRTMGQRVYQLEPVSGFAAQVTAGTVIWASTRAGYPLSTTHVVSGGVMGVGSTRRFSAVRWGVAGNIIVAWVLTLPAAALVAALCYFPIEGIFG